MAHRLILIYAFAISLNPKIKLSSGALLPVVGEWENSLTAESGPLPVNANEEYNGLWQTETLPQHWWPTKQSKVVGTSPLQMTSPSGTSESLRSMKHRRLHHYHMPNRLFLVNSDVGNYTKKQKAPLSISSAAAAPTEYTQALFPKSSSSSSPSSSPGLTSSTSYVDETSISLKLKPYATVTSGGVNINNEKLIDNPRRYNTRRQDQSTTNAYNSKVTIGLAPTQVESRLTHALKPDAKLYYKDNLLAPSSLETRLAHLSNDVRKNMLSVNSVDSEEVVEEAKLTSNDVDSVNLKNIVRPIHEALDKVKQFCDVVKEMLTDDRDDVNNAKELYDLNTDDGIKSKNHMAANEDDTSGIGRAHINVPLMATYNWMLKEQPKRAESLHSYQTSNQEGQGHTNGLENIRQVMPTVNEAQSFTEVREQVLAPRRLEETNLQHDLRKESMALRRSSSSSSLPFVSESERKIKKKFKKKLSKFMLPLLLAYKLKFLTLLPLLVGGLTLLVGSTGLAGFFFALFAAVMAMKGGHGHRSIT